MAKSGRKIIDEAGHRYGRLFVIGPTSAPSGQFTWHCKCDCGEERHYQGAALRNGKIVSCGCSIREKARLLGPINLALISDADRERGRAAVIASNHMRALPPGERTRRKRAHDREVKHKYGDRIRSAARTRLKKQIDNLDDVYIRSIIYGKTGISKPLIPAAAIELQRQIMLIKRFLKENEK